MNTSPRSLREANNQPDDISTGYLTARGHTKIGTKGCSWAKDDRRLAAIIYWVAFAGLLSLAALAGKILL